MNLKEQESALYDGIEQLEISKTYLAKQMYPNLSVQQAANKLKSKIYGTGNITSEEVQALRDTLEGMAKKISEHIATYDIRKKRRDIAAWVEMADLTTEQLEAVKEETIKRMRKNK